MPEESDLEFLKSLDEKMDRNLKIRKIVADAMSGACRSIATEGTRRQKAIEVAKILQTAEEALIDMFERDSK
jgi:hypothetical protein